MNLNFQPFTPTTSRQHAIVTIEHIVDNTALATIIANSNADIDTLDRADITDLVTDVLHHQGTNGINERSAGYRSRIAAAADAVRELYPDLDDDVLAEHVRRETR